MGSTESGGKESEGEDVRTELVTIRNEQRRGRARDIIPGRRYNIHKAQRNRKAQGKYGYQKLRGVFPACVKAHVTAILRLALHQELQESSVENWFQYIGRDSSSLALGKH